MQIPAYFTGLQLQTWMITEYNVPNFLGSHFAMYPSLLVVMGDVAICWETPVHFHCLAGHRTHHHDQSGRALPHDDLVDARLVDLSPRVLLGVTARS